MYTNDDLYADVNQDKAREALEQLLNSHSDDTESIDRLAEYLGEVGLVMCADAGYVLPINYQKVQETAWIL